MRLAFQPYLSAVFVTRNDDHGGDMTRRMQACFSGFIKQCERTGLDAELLVVEWNPPSDRAPLAEALHWPEQTRHCAIRILTVPSSIHREYQHHDKLPINIPVAKNVGTRHARGKFVLQSCVDNLLNNALVDALATQELHERRSYRVDRMDVDRGVLDCESFEHQLAYCPLHIRRIYQKMDLRKEFPAIGRKIPDIPQVHANGSGDFQLFSKTIWELLHGYWESDPIGYGIDVLAACMAYYAGVKEIIFGEPCRLYHIDHDVIWRRPDGISGNPIMCGLRDYLIPPALIPLLRRLAQCVPPPKSVVEKLGLDIVNTRWIELLAQVHRGERHYALNAAHWGCLGYIPEETYSLMPNIESKAVEAG